jgi:hypothetical protein
MPLVVVDAANVIGSVPDGWWRDRRGAVERLRDRLSGLAATGLSSSGVPDWARNPPLEVVLVVEGAARDVEGTETVGVRSAPGVGDDTIVEVVRREADGRRCLVVTSDRALRDRVRELGAEVCGASTLT